MKALYEAISDILLNDSDLKASVQYTTKKKNIRRAFLPKADTQTQVIFYLQPEDVIRGVDGTTITPMLRTAPLIVRVYDREDDLILGDIGERIILLLDGANLSVEGEVYSYDCSYGGELIATHYNDEIKFYEKVLRFMVVFRVDSIAGTSGVPVRRRQRNHW